MQQTTAALPATDTKSFNGLTIVAQITTDGGYSINTMTGPHREANLCFTTPDREVFRLAYRVIGEGGLNGASPEEIRADLDETLRAELYAMQRRTDRPSQVRAWHINNLLDLVSPVSEEALIELAESVGRALDAGVRDADRPRTFADIKRMHAERVEQDRRERVARKQVA